MTPGMWHRVEADRALAAAGMLANRRPPRTARRAGLRLDHIDTLCVLAATHLSAATLADQTPPAWAQLLTPDDGQNPQTAACTPHGDHGTPIRVVAEGSTHPNGSQDVSEGYGTATDVADLICGLKAALRTTETERDQALDKADAYRQKANQILDAVNPFLDAAETLWNTPNPEFGLFNALHESARTARAAITHPTEDLLRDIQRNARPQPEEARQ